MSLSLSHPSHCSLERKVTLNWGYAFQVISLYFGGDLVTKSCPTLVTPWTVACQVLLPMGFSRQEYKSGLPFPSPGDLPDPGIEPGSLALQADSLQTELWGKPIVTLTLLKRNCRLYQNRVLQISHYSKNVCCVTIGPRHLFCARNLMKENSVISKSSANEDTNK